MKATRTSASGLQGALDKTAHPVLLLCLLAACLVGCTAQAAPLPPPAILVTRVAPPAADSAVLLPTPGLEVPVAPRPASPTLLDLAARAYGPRLIVSVDIPAIDVNSPVIAVGWMVKDGGSGPKDIDWDSPGALAGWVVTSALPGDGSNIILYGHNNLYSSIFRDLGNLKTGDEIALKTGDGDWDYSVSRVLFLKTAFADQATLRDYEKYLQPGTKEQLTLVSCWPPLSNTHRVIVLAEPKR